MSTFDGSHDAYRQRVAARVSNAGWREALPELSSSPKFLNGKPVGFAGATLMMPLGPSSPIGQCLGRLQRKVKSVLGTALWAVEPEQFHVTGADLIAGDAYRRELEGPLQEISRPYVSGDEVRGRWPLAGVALFEHAVVALFWPDSPATYRAVVEWRDRLYRQPEIKALGVTQPRPLMVHVTLGYFAELPEMEARKAWLTLQSDLEWPRDACLELTEFSLYRFEDMTAFERVS